MEFSPEDKRRIARAVRQVERQSLNPPLERAQAGAYGAQTAFVRVTSTSTTAGRYPGKVLLFDSSAGTDTDLADCWVVDENGGTLAVSKYIGQRVGDANGEPVFRVCGPGTGGAGATLPISSTNLTFSGARVYNNAAQTVSDGTANYVTLNSENFDTDSYHSTSSNTSRLTAPSTGYYQIGARLLLTPAISGTFTDLVGYLRLNRGTLIDLDYPRKSLAGAGKAGLIELDTIYNLTSGDYVEVMLSYVTSGGSAIIEFSSGSSDYIYPIFWMTRLGA